MPRGGRAEFRGAGPPRQTERGNFKIDSLRNLVHQCGHEDFYQVCRDSAVFTVYRKHILGTEPTNGRMVKTRWIGASLARGGTSGGILSGAELMDYLYWTMSDKGYVNVCQSRSSQKVTERV